MRLMGLTVLEVEVGNPARPKVTERLEFLIDSGAFYSVVPARTLKKLGIKALARDEFRLTDGSRIMRRRGGALFRYGDRVGVADVIFGEPGDSLLLGATTLESMGLTLDPLKRELKPVPLILGGPVTPTRSRAR
jgi:predicted aspartyl protease